jgi:hypothetical protein
MRQPRHCARSNDKRSGGQCQMAIQPQYVAEYHIFLASPGDMNPERQEVRRFFEDYNMTTAFPRGVRFVVVDWENYATAGVGRPQELITSQTLGRYRHSLALVIGLMGNGLALRAEPMNRERKRSLNGRSQVTSQPAFRKSSGSFVKSRSLKLLPPTPNVFLMLLNSGRKSELSASV